MDFESCKRSRLVKKVKPDPGLVRSLVGAAGKRLQTGRLIPLNDTTAASKISLVYDALRELLEAIAITNGYKIYNHECYCAFLKEILKKPNLGDEFEMYRKLRNDINYYGRDVTPDEAKPALESMESLIERIRQLL